jgi:hypothetical protein
MDISITLNDQQTIIKIENSRIIESYLQSEHKGEYIKKLLENGFNISKCLTFTDKCECCEELNGRIDGLTESMQIFNTGGNSSKNGQIGEIFASELFTKRNPDIEYIDTSKTPKSGDAIIRTPIIDKILIDYKNYDSPVPNDEVIKLKRDMDTQNIHYGILISYRSKVSKRNYIDYEIVGENIIVFVSSYGMDILSLEMAVQYIQRLYECNILSISQQVSELVVKGVMKEVTDIYENLYKLSCELSQDINTMKENQEKMNKMFYGMIGNSVHMLSSINLLIDKARETINDIHRESITNIHSYTELNEIIERVIDKEKDKLHGKRILNMTKELNITGYYSDKGHYIHFTNANKIQIGKLHLTKSKVVMIFYNLSEEYSQYNKKYENIKNDNFHIQLLDDSKLWDIVQNRFIEN